MIDRKKLYEFQVHQLKKNSGFKTTTIAFCPENFICFRCGFDLLSDARILSDAEKGLLITGCTNCNKSFVD